MVAHLLDIPSRFDECNIWLNEILDFIARNVCMDDNYINKKYIVCSLVKKKINNNNNSRCNTMCVVKYLRNKN